MHFWIDKRSQQCGFGRSRVAASLSHAGGGLSYGHPPRRAKSSSCSSQPTVHRSLPQTPYDLHQPGTSRQSQYSNNNSLHGQQHMMQQHSSTGTSNNNNGGLLAATGTTSTASNNNNTGGTASSAAVLTGSGTVVPLVARGTHYHHSSTRYQPRSQPHHQQQQQHLQQQLQQQQHHLQQPHQPQQHYSYHHPQFGNMAVPVRHYDAQQQHQQTHSGNVYADDAYSAYHHTSHSQHSSSNSNPRQSTAYATPRRHNSTSNMRMPPTAVGSGAPPAAPSSGATGPSPAAAVAAVQTTHTNQLQQQHHALRQHADSQLLPSHLKCGMCASLVLASVFVAGTKFYFDHQGTGLEVLIFCAFSAAFFLAACLVSLCRIPKSLLSSSGRAERRAAVCHSRGVNAALSGAGAGAGSGVGVGVGVTPATSCLLEMSDVRYLEERQVLAGVGPAATAGPPPYHIAILLPEQTPATLGKQLPLDESPPPSYDKILV
ncbi:hypothetical protein KR009_002816 [Drosophila setifemur]|nr:hypothetical protein KR009_002816 [Drosophila setifemur]